VPGEPEPRMKRTLRAAALSLAIGLGTAFCGIQSSWPALFWLASLVLFVLAAREGGPLGWNASPRAVLLLLSCALLPVLVRVAQMDRARLIYDEFIVAYFSSTWDFAHTSFFAPVPDRPEWVAQFPSPFFLLQRAFFALFGASTLTVRLSVQFYVALVSVMVFLIVSEILDRKTAVVAVVLYSFMAISVYMETFGLMFVSSTAVFSVFFYLALRAYRTDRMSDAAAAGVACGFCYLTYYAGWIALPLLAAMSLARLRKASGRLVLRNLAVACAGAAIVAAPFLAWTLASGDSYLRRAGQVSLLTGSWSSHREEILRGANPLPVIRDNLMLSLKSFVRDGIGGIGGYDFGRLAFFDRFSLVLFVAGLCAGLVLIFRKSGLVFVFLVIAASFMTGVVLTIPPPAYHRLSTAFPFLVVISALPFWMLWRVPKLTEGVRLALVGSLLFCYVSANERHFAEALFRDRPSEEFLLTDLLLQRFGDRQLSIAGWPIHHIQKVLYFRDELKHRDIRPVFLRWAAQTLPRAERYACVVTLADRARKRFEAADPRGRFYRISSFYGIFAN
jgi:hypothetical protein